MNSLIKKMLFLALVFFFSFFSSCKNKSLTDKICMNLSGKKPSELIADDAIKDKRINYLLTLEWDFKSQAYPIAETNTLINTALKDSTCLSTIGGKERYKKLQTEKESYEVLLNKTREKIKNLLAHIFATGIKNLSEYELHIYQEGENIIAKRPWIFVERNFGSYYSNQEKYPNIGY